jgi:hypothetical protein
MLQNEQIIYKYIKKDSSLRTLQVKACRFKEPLNYHEKQEKRSGG